MPRRVSRKLPVAATRAPLHDLRRSQKQVYGERPGRAGATSPHPTKEPYRLHACYPLYRSQGGCNRFRRIKLVSPPSARPCGGRGHWAAWVRFVSTCSRSQLHWLTCGRSSLCLNTPEKQLGPLICAGHDLVGGTGHFGSKRALRTCVAGRASAWPQPLLGWT